MKLIVQVYDNKEWQPLVLRVHPSEAIYSLLVKAVCSDSQANTSSLHWQTYTSVIPLHPGGWEKMSPT